MNKETEILEYIAQDKHISQRTLSKHTGLSLGNINLIISKMVGKGLVKIERLKPNVVKYILTPKGFAEKSKKTYSYIVKSVNYLLKIKAAVEGILALYITEKNHTVYLYGKKDEVYEMIAQVVKESNYEGVTYIEKISEEVRSVSDALIVVWDVAYEEELSQQQIPHINILTMINNVE